MSFRDQNVVTAPGTPQTWLRERFDKKNVCISYYLSVDSLLSSNTVMLSCGLTLAY